MGSYPDGLRKGEAIFYRSGKFAFNLLAGMVLKYGTNCYIGMLQRNSIHFGLDKRPVYRNRACAQQMNISPDSHVMISRFRVPIHKAYIQISFFRMENF